jgi:hypothetical protein
MAQAHWLDSDRLLIQWLPPEAMTLPTTAAASAAAFFRVGPRIALRAIYNLRSTLVEKVFFAGRGVDFAAWAPSQPALYYGGAPLCDWERYVGHGGDAKVPSKSYGVSERAFF